MFPIPTVLAVSLTLTSCEVRQSPESLFREAVLDPIPASVQLLHSSRHASGDGIEIWLHFKISPADFNTLFKSERYQNLGSSPLNYSAYGPPRWWVPESLGQDRSNFDCETKPHFGRDRSAKDIVVNAKEDEVLFLLRSWNNP